MKIEWLYLLGFLPIILILSYAVGSYMKQTNEISEGFIDTLVLGLVLLVLSAIVLAILLGGIGLGVLGIIKLF